MPLPPALAARLAQRGIVKVSEPKKEEVEEVFAEDYDEPSESNVSSTKPEPEVKPDEEENEPIPEEETKDDEKEEDETLVHELSACPNVSNKYHVCVDYCDKRWGMKSFQHDSDMETRRLRMLRKHPLPDGWLEVGDPGTGRYYYWNTNTDQVSWLSPTHRKAEITLPAEKLQAIIKGGDVISEDMESKESDEAEDDDLKEEDDDDLDMDEEDDEDMDIDDDHDFEEMEKELLNEKREQHRDRRSERDRPRGRDKRERSRPDELDPMDPASYSQAPRGTWSSGLDNRGQAKTGVDVTASGPLFQQRPYPSPGAVLRMNKSAPDPSD